MMKIKPFKVLVRLAYLSSCGARKLKISKDHKKRPQTRTNVSSLADYFVNVTVSFVTSDYFCTKVSLSLLVDESLGGTHISQMMHHTKKRMAGHSNPKLIANVIPATTLLKLYVILFSFFAVDSAQPLFYRSRNMGRTQCKTQLHGISWQP
jgi:hypothetical protein